MGTINSADCAIIQVFHFPSPHFINASRLSMGHEQNKAKKRKEEVNVESWSSFLLLSKEICMTELFFCFGHLCFISSQNLCFNFVLSVGVRHFLKKYIFFEHLVLKNTLFPLMRPLQSFPWHRFTPLIHLRARSMPRASMIMISVMILSLDLHHDSKHRLQITNELNSSLRVVIPKALGRRVIIVFFLWVCFDVMDSCWILCTAVSWMWMFEH